MQELQVNVLAVWSGAQKERVKECLQRSDGKSVIGPVAEVIKNNLCLVNSKTSKEILKKANRLTCLFDINQPLGHSNVSSNDP